MVKNQICHMERKPVALFWWVIVVRGSLPSLTKQETGVRQWKWGNEVL